MLRHLVHGLDTLCETATPDSIQLDVRTDVTVRKHRTPPSKSQHMHRCCCTPAFGVCKRLRTLARLDCGPDLPAPDSALAMASAHHVWNLFEDRPSAYIVHPAFLSGCIHALMYVAMHSLLEHAGLLCRAIKLSLRVHS